MRSFFKLLAPLTVLLFAFGFIGQAVAADQLLFGQKHDYSVVFRGNGEAIVYARLVVPDPDETPLAQMNIQISGDASELAIYQQILPQQCLKYNYVNDGITNQNTCTEYGEPNYDYNNSYYGYGNSSKNEYHKLTYSKVGNNYKFNLNTPIQPYKSGAIIVAYTSKSYVKKQLGVFKYNFETIKVPSRIETVTVAIDVDSELVMKEKRSQVSYNSAPTAGLGLASGESVGLSSKSLDTAVSQIGQGSVYKEAKNLSPNESFVVKGTYATSWFLLNMWTIFLVIVVLVGIFVGVYLLNKRFKKKNGPDFINNPSAIPQTVRSPVINLLTLGVSFAVDVVIIGLTYTMRSLESLINRLSDSDVASFLALIAVFFTYLLIGFLPAIIVWVKKGWKMGVSTLVSQLVWFVVYLLIIIILFNS